jgi:hypothetical protein
MRKGKLMPTRLSSDDLVLQYNEKTQTVVLFTRHSSSEPIQLTRFYEIPIGAMNSKSEVLREIGMAVMSYLESTSKKFPFAGVSLDDSDGPDEPGGLGLYSDAQLLILRLGDHSKPEDLTAIDTLLNAAVESGDSHARDYVEKIWSSLRPVFAGRFEREERLDNGPSKVG